MKNLFLIITSVLFFSCETDSHNTDIEVATNYLEANNFLDITLDDNIPIECPTSFQHCYYFTGFKIYNYRKIYTVPAKGCIYWNTPNDIKIHPLIRY